MITSQFLNPKKKKVKITNIMGKWGNGASLGSFEPMLFNQFKVLLGIFLKSEIYDNCQDFLLWLQKGQIVEQAIFQHRRDLKKMNC